MLPFASSEYFIIAAIFVVFMLLSKLLLSKYLPFSGALFFASVAYIVFYFPKPYHIALYLIYTYGIYYLFTTKIKSRNKLAGIILLLGPMLFVKFHIKIHSYPYHISDFVAFGGLSYISFRIVGLFIDTEPGSKPVNFFKYLNFLLFTPTLLIGPIDRFHRFNGDVEKGYAQINSSAFALGGQSLMLGIFYKYVCAEALNQYWLEQVNSESLHWLDMTSNMYGYYLFLFFDFAGYSAMAIGIGKMMGIEVPINFDKPFLARNPQDFWRRFHKSLGDWLKDYFFMPLYKFFSQRNKLKPYPLLRQNMALFLTFLLMGLWNGFQLNYILSGAIFAVYSVVHNSYLHYCKKNKRDVVFGSLNENAVRWISVFIVFHLVAFSIYIFSGRCPLI